MEVEVRGVFLFLLGVVLVLVGCMLGVMFGVLVGKDYVLCVGVDVCLSVVDVDGKGR